MIENLKWDCRLKGDTPLRQMQLTGLRLLKVLDAVCKEIGVEYALMYGTFLGAVRHKGFIPWDDDIDLVMTEPNYQKFMREAPAHLPKDVFMGTPGKIDCNFVSWLKLYDAYSSVYDEKPDVSGRRHQGISLDVFPWYLYPDGVFAWLAKLVQIAIYTSKRLSSVSDSASLKARLLKPFAKVVYYCAWGLMRVLAIMAPTKAYGMHPDVPSTCRFVRYRPQDFYPLKSYVFEDGTFPGPSNPDSVLTRRYGKDYMSPPPKHWMTPHCAHIEPTTPCAHPKAMPWPEAR